MNKKGRAGCCRSPLCTRPVPINLRSRIKSPAIFSCVFAVPGVFLARRQIVAVPPRPHVSCHSAPLTPPPSLQASTHTVCPGKPLESAPKPQGKFWPNLSPLSRSSCGNSWFGCHNSHTHTHRSHDHFSVIGPVDYIRKWALGVVFFCTTGFPKPAHDITTVKSRTEGLHRRKASFRGN